jgi:glycosyltransferase involved in cell wall biosynthesis
MSSSGKAAGGWLRFQEVLNESPEENVQYDLVDFKAELQNPIMLGVFAMLFSMISAFIYAIKEIKKGTIQIILSPAEVPQAIILAYLSSKVMGRKFVTFLNTVPCYGMIDVPALQKNPEKIRFKNLFKVNYEVNKKPFNAILETLVWYLSLKMIASPSAHIMCLSPFVAEELSKLGLKKQIVPIYPGNGINYDEISTSIKETPSDKYDAIYAAGNFHRQKGVFEAIKIWSKVAARFPEAKMAVAGVIYYKSPQVIGELNVLIRELGLQHNVVILGDPFAGLPQKNLWQAMKDSKMFIYPTWKDVWPLIVGEALACGLPVIVNDLKSIRLAYGDCLSTFFVENNDVEAAAKVSIKLLSDDSLLKDLSCKASQYAESKSWSNVVKLERQAYLIILTNKNLPQITINS